MPSASGPLVPLVRGPGGLGDPPATSDGANRRPTALASPRLPMNPEREEDRKTSSLSPPSPLTPAPTQNLPARVSFSLPQPPHSTGHTPWTHPPARTTPPPTPSVTQPTPRHPLPPLPSPPLPARDLPRTPPHSPKPTLSSDPPFPHGPSAPPSPPAYHPLSPPPSPLAPPPPPPPPLSPLRAFAAPSEAPYQPPPPSQAAGPGYAPRRRGRPRRCNERAPRTVGATDPDTRR